MSTEESTATFRTKTNLVLVPVVVRDKAGRAMGNLRREDFQILDQGKAQSVASFAVETSGVGTVMSKGDASAAPAEAQNTSAPNNFVAYIFDDMNTAFSDLASAREAAKKHLTRVIGPLDRAAVYTTSGLTMQEFTDDRTKLLSALDAMRPRSMNMKSGNRCPPEINAYVADAVANHSDREALSFVIGLETVCGEKGSSAEIRARTDSEIANQMYQREARIALDLLRNAVKRMAAMPGRRAIVFASAGFLSLENQHDRGTILDLAARSNVIINTIDARGLYGDPGIDAADEGSTFELNSRKSQYERMNASVQQAILAELADGTGGSFFHNRNDLEEGFRRAAARPEYLYVLGFSPQNLKLDGHYHALKVTLREGKGMTVRARRGYFAPSRLEDAAEQAREEVREALFSREEMRDVPAEMRTQFFKPTDDTAKLNVLVKLDIRTLPFRKSEGRNTDDVTVIVGLFDRDGNFVKGLSKLVKLRLLDQTLQAKLQNGITLKNTFDVKPGGYAIRLVVRDSEGQQMAAQNGSVEIPY